MAYANHRTDDPDDYTGASLEELIDELSSCGVPVPPGLAEAIAAHGSEAVPALSLLVSQPALWYSESADDPIGWAPVHAMHLLGMIGDPAAVEALLAPLRWNEPSDFVTEDMPGVLARLGPEAIPALREFVRDAGQDETLRGIAYDGLAGMALLDPSLAEEVKEIGRAVASRCLAEDEAFPTFIGLTLAMFQESGDRALLQALYERGYWERLIANWGVVERVFREGFRESRREHFLRDPAHYFSQHEQAHLARTQEEEQRAEEKAEEEDDLPWRPAPPAPAVKIGRNQPCPCGSGRKYKKCCGKGGPR